MSAELQGDPTQSSSGNVADLAVADLSVEITTNDLPDDVQNELRAQKEGSRTLGVSAHAVLDALPGTVARKIASLVPADFEMCEISLKLKVEVKIPGFGAGGEATLKLRPKS